MSAHSLSKSNLPLDCLQYSVISHTTVDVAAHLALLRFNAKPHWILLSELRRPVSSDEKSCRLIKTVSTKASTLTSFQSEMICKNLSLEGVVVHEQHKTRGGHRQCCLLKHLSYTCQTCLLCSGCELQESPSMSGKRQEEATLSISLLYSESSMEISFSFICQWKLRRFFV